MINPENKRELVFNDELQELFGCESAAMTQLTRLLVPHIDVGGGAVEQVKVKGVKVKQSKRECATPMKKQKLEAKNEPSSRQSPKSEIKVKTDVSTSAVNLDLTSEQSSPVKQVKSEPNRPCSNVTFADVEEASAAIQPRLMAISRDSATIAFIAPPGAFLFHAVATPDAPAETEEKRTQKLCNVEVRETPSGDFEQHAQTELRGLDPSVPYRLSIRVRAATAGTNDAVGRADSLSVALPQRAAPGDWTPHEALIWSSSVQVPEFSQKMSEYGINGTTLMSLGEEDLRGLGIAAPFLVRRVLGALKALGDVVEAG